MHNQPSPAGGPGGPGGSTISDDDRLLAAYLTQHQGKATFLAAAASAMEAGPLIVLTGKPVMALGGFNGQDRTLTLAQFQKRVAAGEVRFVLIGGGRGPGGPPPMNGMGGGPPPGMGGPPMGGGLGMGPPMGRGNSEIFQWVREHGKPVQWKPEEQENDDSDFSFAPPMGRFGQRQLYDVSGT
jgi:4-amino-4-deoxy-L-arabinose transferase-like glycosyltransferase